MNSYYLTMEERQFLLRKHMKNGSTFEQAVEKVNNNINFIKKKMEKLVLKNLTDKELNERFQEEFEKICREY